MIANVNVGLLAIFAITSMGVYGVALAGWSSNNKYSLLGGLRSSAQMISYELSLTLSVVGVLLLAGTLQSERDRRCGRAASAGASCPSGTCSARTLPQVLGFFCYFIAAVAETNRAPFDLAEAESELVAGYHTEYSSFKFAMFFHGRIRQHDHGRVPGDDPVLRRLALALSANGGLCLDALSARGRLCRSAGSR